MADEQTTKMEPKSEYQRVLHVNYHHAKRFAPVPGCPYCPQKPQS